MVSNQAENPKKNTEDFSSLLLLAKQGNQLAIEKIFDQYKWLVYIKSQRYFSVSSDREDLIQEGLIGLYNAINYYDKKQNSNFRAFANLCIKRQLITHIKKANRQKHKVLNTSISLFSHAHQNPDYSMFIDFIPNVSSSNPYIELEAKEFHIQIKKILKENLSKLEWDVFRLFMNGYTYKEISETLNEKEKAIDNAIQRIRKKSINFKQEII